MLSFNTKNNKGKTVVGFNTGHDGGCAIIHNGQVISISEERLNRKKHSDGYINSFFYCLNGLGIKISDVDLFVSSSYSENLPECFMGAFKALGLPSEKFITIDHHLSHAYSAFATSPFNEAIIIVIDGSGNVSDTESYYLGDSSGSIKKVGGNNSNRSIYKGIGRAYESFTNFIGWSHQEAGKTMGLAAYGKEKYPDIQLYKINDTDEIESYLNSKYYHGALDFIKNNKLDLGKPFSGFDNKDAAFFIQDRTEKIILELVERLYKKYNIPNVCLAGGVFLNSIINKKILDQTSIKEVFIPPCCDDTGQPLGNAIYGYGHHLGEPMSIKMDHGYLGKEYSDDEILDVVEKKQKIYTLPYEVKSRDIEYRKSDNLAKDVAKLLSEGNIIGWFQGASEIGPRALGHRSILCAPFPSEMKDILNNRIKHRENFRPFAPVILEEKVGEYFALDRPSPFMLLVAKAKEENRDKIPAVLHYDYTARIQTVTQKTHGTFYDLIKEFENITNIPVILNTSFNDSGEPIVETPRDAIMMFYKSELDYLILGEYILWKNNDGA